MIATKRERNLNDIAWPVLDEEYGDEQFTPCRPLEGVHILKSDDWPPQLKTDTRPNLVDEDIRAGRVKRFKDPEDMISSLKRPWQD